MPEVKVTVDVDLDDVRDVIAFHRKDTSRAISDFNGRVLRRYANLDGPLRDAFWMQIPTSLGWCIDTVEREGVTTLEQLLVENGQTTDAADG